MSRLTRRHSPLQVTPLRVLSIRPRTALAAATLAAAGCGLVLPAAGVAQGPGPGGFGPSSELVLNGPTIKGFKLSGSTLKVGSFVFMSDVKLTRRSQGATETHVRGFRRTDGGPNELPTLELTSSLSKGTLKAHVRGDDRLSLTFRATEKAKRLAMPRNFGIGARGAAFTNCTGEDGRSRKGVLKGTLRISMGSYFNTIKLKRLKARVIDLPERSCDRRLGAAPTEPELQANGEHGSYYVQRLGNGKTFHFVSAQDGPISRFITTEGEGSSFSYSDDAATATATGVGPLLSGTLTYTGHQFHSNGASGTYSSGSSSGGITGRFVSGNVRVPGSGAGASLAVPGSQQR